MHAILISITIILGLGVLAQVVASRIHLPSILLLLLSGILVGPVLRAFWPHSALALDPESIFGDLISPIVSLGVALILYEGGLSLRFRELHTGGAVISKLVTVGAALTWLLSAVAANLVLGLPWGLALVFGAILTVSGPTVIIPLVHHVRPKGAVGPIMRWEGIVIDPIGALLAVLVFEAVVGEGGHEAVAGVFYGVVYTIVVGGGLGLLAGWLLVRLIHNYLVPDFLQNAVSFAMVVVTFTICDTVQEESGLLAATVMGIYLANQRTVDIEHIIEFKENLRVLLISSLFVLLAARLDPSDLQAMGIPTVIFVALLIVLIRPIAVFVSTLGSRLQPKERVLLACVAPRGIVAAAIAPALAFELLNVYPDQAGRLAPLTFAVIVGTVLVYGVCAPFIARKLNLADTNPQGVLMLGGQPWARAIGKALKSLGIPVMIVDSNYANTAAAWMDGVPAYHGSVLSDSAFNEIELTGIGRFIALTPNDQVNTLATQRLSRLFGRVGVYQVAARPHDDSSEAIESAGRILAGPDATYRKLTTIWGQRGGVLISELTPEYTFDDLLAEHGDSIVPLFVLSESGRLSILTPSQTHTFSPGQRVISLASNVQRPDEDEKDASA